jgi:alpha-galactosidase
MSAHGPKIVVIGAGSYFFGKPVIRKMALSSHFAGGTLAFVDTDPGILKTMTRLARRIFRETECGVKTVGSTDRREVMRDADFVVLTFSDRNAHFRGIDTRIAAKHGIRMCSSDTIGPGGIFRALREVPHALAMARDVKRLAPQAWTINFVNPTTVLGMALRRYAPEVKSFALCDGLHEPRFTLKWLRNVGVLPPEAKSIPPEIARKVDLEVSGVNHFGWMTRFAFDGKDLMPALRKYLRAAARREREKTTGSSKGRLNATYQLELFDIFGVMPVTIAHTKEYVPYFQGYGVKPPRPEPIALFNAETRADQMREAWDITKEFAAGKRPLKEFLKKYREDHAMDIIETMWADLGKQFYINTANNGAVPNLPDDAFLELRCDLDIHGPRPQPCGPLPLGVRGLQMQVLDTHELTAQAAVECDRAILRRVMLTDPICNNIGDAEACMADLLEAQRDVLPRAWFRVGRPR